MTKRPQFGKRPKVKEAPILQHVKTYLAFEGFTLIRINCGKARVGGSFTKNPDGSVTRRGEQWVPLAPAGTPDIVFQIPAQRPVVNPWTLEREAYPVARIGWIETKREGDGELSDEQECFIRKCEFEGSLVWVIDDVDQLRKWIPPKNELRFY